MSTLKKYAYGLLLTTFGLINFGYCENVENLIDVVQENSSYNVNSRWKDLKDLNSSDYGVYCLKVNSYQGYGVINFGYSHNLDSVVAGDYITMRLINSLDSHITCITVDQPHIWVGYVDSQSSIIDYELFKLDDLLAEALPLMTSLECQQEYNLIPLSSVDENYCVSNGLCPSSGGGECSGSGDNWSALYINNTQYNGAPTIRVTIPEEIERDQYTDEEETTIDVIGYGYDQEKMQQMVNTQYYKPTPEEMSGLIEKIADFLPLVAVALLITRLRRVIKKVF